MASKQLSTEIEISPNLGRKMSIVSVTSTENDDWADMADHGYKSVDMAIALVSNAAEASVTINGTKIIFGAGGTDVLKVLVIGA